MISLRSVLGACSAAALFLLVVSAPSTAQAPDSGTEPATGDTAELSSMSPQELFLRASSSALQFEHMRQPARRLLIRDRERTLPYLLTRLDTDDARERHALEDIIVKMEEPAVAPLVDAMATELRREDTSRGARLAASILGRLKDSAAVPALVSGIGHEDWKVRSAAAGALGRVGAPQAVNPLLPLLDDKNEIVRKSAAVALARIAEADQAGLDAAAIARLVRALDDPYYAVRFSASRALGAAGERALEALESVAAGGAERPRLLAIEALGRVGSPRTLAALTGSDDWVVRAHAAAALGRADPASSDIDRLRELATDPHPLVRAAAGALGGD